VKIVLGELHVTAATPVVVDSSVAFKWFDTSEPDADQAAELLARHAADEIAIVVPAHLCLEVTHALARRCTPADVARSVDALYAFELLQGPLDRWLVSEAAALASRDGLALYDAVFVALAARLDAELVTADRKQAGTSSCRVRLLG